MARSKEVAHRADRHVGEQVRARRSELGLTQHDFASALGISYQQVQKYETGANRISAGRLYEMAQRLTIPVEDFFIGLDPTSKAEELPHGGRNRGIIEAVKNFASIEDGEVRTTIALLVKSIAGRKKRR